MLHHEDYIQARLLNTRFPLASAYLNFWSWVDAKLKPGSGAATRKMIVVSDLTNFIVKTIDERRSEPHFIPSPYKGETP